MIFTSLDKKAFPLIRCRTCEKCSCGRTHVRMTKPKGRSDDMLKIRGVNVFSSRIETVLMNNGYAANYQILVGSVNNTDMFEFKVEMASDMFTDNVGERQTRRKVLEDGLRSMLGIKAKVTLVAILAPVLAYAIADEAGDLNNLLNKFTEADVNIEYMYAFASKECAYMIFRVNDTKKAEALLNDKGLKSLTQEEIFAL